MNEFIMSIVEADELQVGHDRVTPQRYQPKIINTEVSGSGLSFLIWNPPPLKAAQRCTVTDVSAYGNPDENMGDEAFARFGPL